jgi:hypothetical protein
MNNALVTDLVALAIRHLSTKTNILPQQNSFDNLISTVLTGKSADVRMAEDVVATAATVTAAAKRIRTNRKFRKITQYV